jgi:hypothetical protein
MPILKDSVPVFYPETDYSVVKYIDLTKFLSLLHKQSLFFCRLDKLEDQFEGTTAKANFDYRVKYHQYLREIGAFKEPFTDEDIYEQVKFLFETEKKFKAIHCVCCWNKKEDESAALWKIYSDFSKGIMIRSSISRLKKSLEITQEEIRLSEIRYLNYEREIMPDGNIIFPIIHKQKAYAYEDEVRLIYETKQDGLEHDWTKEYVQEGIYIQTDLNELIEEIIIGPYSPIWYYELVKDITIKFGLNKPINRSVLTFNE